PRHVEAARHLPPAWILFPFHFAAHVVGVLKRVWRPAGGLRVRYHASHLVERAETVRGGAIGFPGEPALGVRAWRRRRAGAGHDQRAGGGGGRSGSVVAVAFGGCAIAVGLLDHAIQLVIGGTGRDPVCVGVAVQVAIGVVGVAIDAAGGQRRARGRWRAAFRILGADQPLGAVIGESAGLAALVDAEEIVQRIVCVRGGVLQEPGRRRRRRVVHRRAARRNETRRGVFHYLADPARRVGRGLPPLAGLVHHGGGVSGVAGVAVGSVRSGHLDYPA